VSRSFIVISISGGPPASAPSVPWHKNSQSYNQRNIQITFGAILRVGNQRSRPMGPDAHINYERSGKHDAQLSQHGKQAWQCTFAAISGVNYVELNGSLTCFVLPITSSQTHVHNALLPTDTYAFLLGLPLAAPVGGLDGTLASVRNFLSASLRYRSISSLRPHSHHPIVKEIHPHKWANEGRH
jgi:hypothetical protein